eukprot:scaffold682605_cov84-Prasinocladus_malaysianus.AAC.1
MRHSMMLLGVGLVLALFCASIPASEGRTKDLNNLSPSDKAKLQRVLDSLDQDDGNETDPEGEGEDEDKDEYEYDEDAD